MDYTLVTPNCHLHVSIGWLENAHSFECALRHIGFLPRNLRPIPEPKHGPIIPHHRHPVDGRCPELLVKLGKHLRAGGDVADKGLKDPRPAFPLTLGRLQRRFALGCLPMPLQVAVVPLIQDPLVGGIVLRHSSSRNSLLPNAIVKGTEIIPISLFKSGVMSQQLISNNSTAHFYPPFVAHEMDK